MKAVKLGLVALLAGLLSTASPAVAAKSACENCRTIAAWYIHNTDMTMDEVAGWLITCYDVWDCWDEET